MSIQAPIDDSSDEFDFFNIPVDSVKEANELDDYLLQALEKVRDPISWWWEHCHVYPRLSAMAFDYLSIPGMSIHILQEFTAYCII